MVFTHLLSNIQFIQVSSTVCSSHTSCNCILLRWPWHFVPPLLFHILHQHSEYFPPCLNGFRLDHSSTHFSNFITQNTRNKKHKNIQQARWLSVTQGVSSHYRLLDNRKLCVQSWDSLVLDLPLLKPPLLNPPRLPPLWTFIGQTLLDGTFGSVSMQHRQ